MALGENISAKEKLIEFIHNLTDDECVLIISSYNQIYKREQA